MRFAVFVLFAAVFGVTLAPGFGETAKKSSSRKTTSSTARKTSTVKKISGTPSRSTSARTTASRKTTPARKGAVRRPVVARQAVPTADRYKEIQQALADKGYLKSEPNGVWDADSVDAMKRFQADRKQDPSGKLTAAALIDLGLGPKHEIPAAPVKGPGEVVSEPPKVDVAPAPQP